MITYRDAPETHISTINFEHFLVTTPILPNYLHISMIIMYCMFYSSKRFIRFK